MSTINLTWDACGSAAVGTNVYYGKSLIVTGNPITGTGWTLYTGAALTNTATSAALLGLDDNVEYLTYVYCQCASSGNGPLVNAGPYIKYVCPTVTASTTSSAVSYTLTVPASANNAGTWIQTIRVTLLDSAGVTVLSTNVHTSPFTGTISSNFTGLAANTTYTLKVAYSNNAVSRTNACTTQTLTTAVSCVAPTVTISNITATSFDVAWTPTGGGDTFNLLINSSAIATGLVSSPFTVTGRTAGTTYQVNIVRNCSSGGNATSTTQNVSTSAAVNTVFVSNSLPNCSITSITGIPGYTFSGPVNVGGSSNGTHSAYSATRMQVTVGGSSIGASNLEIDINGSSFQLIAIPSGAGAGGVYLSNPISVSATDTIEISLDTP